MPFAIPTTPAVGDQITAAQAAVVATDLGIIGAAWTPYTPVVTGYTSVTTTVSGAYIVIGKTCYFRAQYALATVTTLGVATILVSLPFTAAASYTSKSTVGPLSYWTTTATVTGGVVVLAPSATVLTMYTPPPGAATPNMGLISGSQPSGQIAGVTVAMSGCYEIA